MASLIRKGHYVHNGVMLSKGKTKIDLGRVSVVKGACLRLRVGSAFVLRLVLAEAPSNLPRLGALLLHFL